MNQTEFYRLQQTQMEIMDEVHRVCAANGIQYYIIGGTALGAVRHGGFIPWDVDIDIAMPRADYERFAQIGAREMSSRFVINDYRNTKSFTHPHMLVCIKNTYLSNKFSKFNPNEQNLGIYLDVFPLDTAPADKALQIRHAKQLHRLRRLKDFKHGYRYNNDKLKAFLKKLVSSLIFWTDLDRLNAAFDRRCRQYESTDSPYWCSMSSHYSYAKQCMSAEIYGTPRLIRFEDRQYYAPERLEEYLTRIYGDYMKLPPASERKMNLDLFDTVRFDCDEDQPR